MARRVVVRTPGGRTRQIRVLREGFYVGGYFIEVDGARIGALVDGVGDIVFSPDTQHWAVVVQTGKKLRVMVDGASPGPEVSELLSPVFFSPDGLHVSYTARVASAEGDLYRLYLDREVRHEEAFARGFDAMDHAPGPLFDGRAVPEVDEQHV